MRDHAEISEEGQGDFWPTNIINKQLVGHDILQKLKKETDIGEQKQNKR
jgi:hypothetical protein